jgi:anaerobic selenocysteine-containing dehydrogenase
VPTHTVKGACPLDCQDTCAWVAHVADGRVVRLTGAQEHPFTRGALCAKVNFYHERTYDPDRLLYPLRRSGPKGSGQFRRVSWDEALDEIAARFLEIAGEWGPEALLPHQYAGNMGALQRFSLLRLFNRLGASRTSGGLCAAAGAAGLTEVGSYLPYDPEDMAHARLILLWASNPLTSGHHSWHFIQEARRQGARVIAIDPRRTRTAAQCDAHLAVRPGTDGALALAIGHVILAEGLGRPENVEGLETYRLTVADWTPERAAAVTGVPAETIRELAREYAAAHPAAIKCGVTFQEHSGGAETLMAIAALPALCGHWALQGGGLHYVTSPAQYGDRVAGNALNPSARRLPLGALGAVLTDTSLAPPVRGLMIWGTNPLATQPDSAAVRRGLLREDLFTVVLEHYMTDTARLADLVLPSTTQLEHFDVLGSWGHLYFTANLPAIEPLGESRPHFWVLTELSRRLGLPEESAEAMAQEFLGEVSLAELKERGWVKAPRPFEVPRVRLDFTPRLMPEPPAEFPLVLISPKAHHTLNSSFINQPRHRKSEGFPSVEMHPDDAAAWALQDGALVRIVNRQGEVQAYLKVSGEICAGAVAMPGRWWGSLMPGGNGVNLLTAGRLTEKGGQPVYNECFVQVTE